MDATKPAEESAIPAGISCRLGSMWAFSKYMKQWAGSDRNFFRTKLRIREAGKVL